MDWINLSIFILFILLFAVFVFDSVRLRLVNKKIFNSLAQAEIDKGIISDKLNKTILEHSAEKSDGFLRFMEDSREDAYRYIEETQEAIKVFDEEIGPVVKYYKDTGRSTTRKISELLQKISMAYDIIMTLMPEEKKPEQN